MKASRCGQGFQTVTLQRLKKKDLRYNRQKYLELVTLMYLHRNLERIHPETLLAFLSLSRKMPKRYIKLRCNRFLQNPYQLIIHQFSSNSNDSSREA